MPTINPTTSVNISASTGNTGMASIAGTDFMNILVKQLQMQDPFKPMTNAEMVQQLSTIRELEMNTRLSSKLEQLTDQQRFGSAAALIGKKVTGSVSDGNGNEYKMAGVVTGISFTKNGDVMLELDSGDTLPLAGLRTVTNPDGTPIVTDTANKDTAAARAIATKAEIINKLTS